MSAKTKSMHQIKQIIELYSKGNSIRHIERMTGMSRNTIRDYLRKISVQNIAFEQLLTLDEQSLSALVYREEIPMLHGNDRYQVIEQQMDYLAKELPKRGVTRQLLWEEYRKNNRDGYGYSQFCEHLARHLKSNNAVMHFAHQPGEQMQVDFAGDKLHYADTSTGELILCEVLVCVLPFSHYTFAIALRSQKQEEFISGICRSLEYIGGVPQSIKCDNLRSAVTKSNRYEPKFTEAMEYIGEHYGTTFMAARVRKPRDKASVEKAVDLSYKRIYAPLRHHTFFSIEELNVAIRKQLEEHNSRLFKGKDYSRKKLWEEEKSFLKELPATRYEIKHIAMGKVQKNYHVIVGEDFHQYSVPFALIGKRLKIIYTADAVEIYDDLKRVAMHKRNYKKHGYSTKEEHMPANHRHQFAAKGWNADYFEKQAAAIGTSTLAVIKKILTSKIFYEQTYNSCLGILRLGKQYTNERLEAACHHALPSPVLNYRTINNILKNNRDKQSTLFDEPVSSIPEHHQLRGPSAYQ